MEDGDLLLAVNREPVETMEHDDIVKIVRRSGDRVSLTCITTPGREFYREVSPSSTVLRQEIHQTDRVSLTALCFSLQLGISPLLFHEEFFLQDEKKQTETEFLCIRNQSGTRLRNGCVSYSTASVQEREKTGPGFHSDVPVQKGTLTTQVPNIILSIHYIIYNLTSVRLPVYPVSSRQRSWIVPGTRFIFRL